MPRFSGGARSAGAGSTILPVGSLYGVAASGGSVREVGIFNTTSTAVALKLLHVVATGTQGAGLVEAKQNSRRVAASCTLFDTHTVDPTASAVDLGYRVTLGAAIGSGVIWTFGDVGLLVDNATTDGIGIIPATGTGQIVDWYMVWDE
jgi:hypothetical protein